MKSVVIAPEYNSFYVAGSLDVDVPIEYGNLGVFGTNDCLVVGCLYWNDGDTRMTLGRSDEIPAQSMPLRFDGSLNTPEKRILLFDVNMPEILSMEVAGRETRVRIWTNHASEPDKIVIAAG
jgi:hypothetical protein